MNEDKTDSSQFSPIYSALINALTLLPEHRLQLKAKRGFSDETIDALKFRSCSSDATIAISKLDFTPAELRAAGVMLHDEPNPKLLGDNILIPFLDGANCTGVKPHKNAFAGFAIRPYLPAPLKSFAIIAESEFKAAAALQLGYSAIGVTGVSSFAGKHFSDLVETLQRGGVITCCIIFDNELKDKKAYWDRWDTQYYAYLMAVKLESSGIEATIATLPDSWRVDGKADIDGALAMGKVKEDFDLVVRGRKSPADYLKALPPDAQHLVLRRFKKGQATHTIFVDHGRYSTYGSEEKAAQIVSDFTFSIDNNTYGTDGECRRELTLTNDVGDCVAGILFGSEDFSHPIAFKKKCMSLGDFQFTGGMKHLESIIALETSQELGKKIYQPDHVGWIRPSETRPGSLYLYENGVVSSDGERLAVGKDGVSWQGMNGFQAVSLAQGEERSGIPRLWHENVDPNKLIDDIQENFGGWHGVRLACSWLVASLFSHQLSQLYGSAFPLLFISGQQGSGKSTLCRWLSAMAGIFTEGSNYWSGTLVGFQRLAAYYSSGPVWIDEFRNSQSDNSIKAKEGFLRGAYDGQSGAKGVRTPFGVRSATIRGRILLSGQDTPADQALLQRCIVVRLIQKQRTGEHYADLNRHIETFSGIIPELVKRFEQNKRKVVDEIEKFRKVLMAQGVDDRTAITYAIPVGLSEGILRENDVGFYKSIISQAKLSFQAKEAEKPYRQFLAAMEVLELQEKVNGNCLRATNGGLAIHMNLAMQLWSEMLNRSKRDYPFKLETLYNEFEEAEILIAKTKSVRLKGGDARACCVLDPEKDDLVKQLFDRAVDEI